MKLPVKLYYSVLVITLLVAASCKKSPAPSGGYVAGSTTNTSQSGDPQGVYSGVLLSLYANTSTLTVETADADFYSTPIAFHVLSSPTGNISAGSVFLNNVRLKFAGNRYNDTTNTLVVPPAIWTVTGSTAVPSFTYTNTNDLPAFSGVGSLPSTIDKNQNQIINLSGVYGCDQVVVEIEANNSAADIASSSSASSVTFQKSSLTTLSSGTGRILVALIKYNPQFIAGKNFLFVTGRYYVKENVTIQ